MLPATRDLFDTNSKTKRTKMKQPQVAISYVFESHIFFHRQPILYIL
jgi:hypothetical protein